MLCQRCHKNLATVRYAEVVDGNVSEQHLCADCMARQQADTATGFELSGSAPTPRLRHVAAVSDTTMPQRSCRACGVELQEVIRSGRVGCSVCYESFRDQLESVLRGMHVALRHRGKVPHRDDAREQKRADLQTKRALLRSALKTEDYEEAANLRDTIRSLEDSLRDGDAKPPSQRTKITHA
jgi:protein arginine kinase activator